MTILTVSGWFRLIGLTITANSSLDPFTEKTTIASKLGGNIVAGAGYSSDTQQMSTNRCFKATVSSISEKQTRMELNRSLSFSELENSLGIFVDRTGELEMFSIDAQADYMRSLQDNDHAISLNYYTSITNNVSVKIGGRGDEALTESGKSLYNRHRNRYFGLICGDKYISSYQQGGLLIIGLNLEFSSSIEKETFISESGFAMGDMVNATKTVKEIVAKNEITGLVTVQSFQIGGDQSLFYNILAKHNDEKPYAMTCSFSQMDDCLETAKIFLNYAKNDFPKQFQNQNNSTFMPLGTGFTQYLSIKEIGLISPVSLVTQEVVLYRKALSRTLKENMYYRYKIYPFINKGYPGKLSVSFIQQANAVLSEADNNILILMQPHGGAADCFNSPDKCKSTKVDIDSQVYNIKKDDLAFLDDIKYMINVPGGIFYNTAGKSADSWVGVSDDSNKIFKLKSVYINDKECFYCAKIVDKKRTDQTVQACFRGNLTCDGNEYDGIVNYQLPTNVHFDISSRALKKTSPFFFERYNTFNNLQQRL